MSHFSSQLLLRWAKPGLLSSKDRMKVTRGTKTASLSIRSSMKVLMLLVSTIQIAIRSRSKYRMQGSPILPTRTRPIALRNNSRAWVTEIGQIVLGDFLLATWQVRNTTNISLAHWKTYTTCSILVKFTLEYLIKPSTEYFSTHRLVSVPLKQRLAIQHVPSRTIIRQTRQATASWTAPIKSNLSGQTAPRVTFIATGSALTPGQRNLVRLPSSTHWLKKVVTFWARNKVSLVCGVVEKTDRQTYLCLYYKPIAQPLLRRSFLSNLIVVLGTPTLNLVHPILQSPAVEQSNGSQSTTTATTGPTRFTATNGTPLWMTLQSMSLNQRMPIFGALIVVSQDQIASLLGSLMLYLAKWALTLPMILGDTSSGARTSPAAYYPASSWTSVAIGWRWLQRTTHSRSATHLVVLPSVPFVSSLTPQ